MKQFNFRGLMVPVFTAFNEDKKRTINFDIIDKYAQLLKQKNIQGVLVNSTTGEGTTLKVEERKRLTEEWFKVCRKYQLNIMVHIGGTTIAEVYELAEHAEKLGVDAVLVLPDLFFKPRFEEDLVNYLKDVASYCPNRPLLYYHMPEYTKVYLSMTRFWDLVEREVQNFAGVYYAHHNLDEATTLLKRNRFVIYAGDNTLIGALTLGFDTIASTLLNIVPEHFVEIYELVRTFKLREAMAAQEKLHKRIYDVYRPGFDWVQTWKVEMNKVQPEIRVGVTRKPILNIINKQY